MIKQYLKKRAKILKGAYKTFIQKRGQSYHDTEWWNENFYTKGISDRQTISSGMNPFSAKYHYNSVEMQILRNLYRCRLSLNQSTILDIGSGSGHWIDFYRTMGASRLIGLDVSRSSVNYLQEKYSNDINVDINYGKASKVISRLEEECKLVNAIGVMFHIVDDDEWYQTINTVATCLQKDGLFIVGGHFGWLDGVNVQIDSKGHINKRLRNRKHWTKALRQAGFSRFDFYKNQSYLWIDDLLPENNLLIATK